jgi:peroxiredoxin
VAQLRQSTTEIESRDIQVTLISFGTIKLAHAWIAETKSDFDFLLDPDRRAYRAYGLQRSLFRSWKPKIWLEYARLLSQGRKWRGIQGDSGQLGGDFVIDQSGIIRLAYRSYDPADRPAVSDLIEIFDRITNE